MIEYIPILTILISLSIGFVLGVYVMYARYKNERKKRLWAEQQMVNAHERILELEKEFNPVLAELKYKYFFK